MKSPLLNASGDIVIRNNDFVMLEGDEELAQCVRVTYKTDKGEYFLDPTFGLNKEPLLAKQFDEVEATDAIVEATGQEERIESVTNVTFNKINRLLEVNVELVKDSGEKLPTLGVEF